ncbi:MAG: hypothetical protein AB7P07_04110 [Hyphomonadaceae bacterium]
MPEAFDSQEADLGDQIFGVFDEAGGSLKSAGLLDQLRAAGLQIGAREHNAVGVLVAALLGQSSPPPKLQSLHAQIAPLVARTPQERETFSRVFNAFAGVDTGSARAAGVSSDALLAGDARRGRFARLLAARSTRIAAVVLGATTLIAALAFLLLRTPPQELTSDAPQQAVPAPAAISVQAEASTSEGALAPAASASVSKVARIARTYAGAPTLAELAEGLAAESPIEWDASAYEARLHELTGLPRHQPLALYETAGSRPNSAAVWARLARAIDRVETPGRESSYAAYLNATAPILGDDPADPPGGSAWSSAAAPARRLEAAIAQRLGATEALPTERNEAIARVRSIMREHIDAHIIERTLASATDPRIRRVFPEPLYASHADIERERAIPPITPWIVASAPLLSLGVWLLAGLARRKAFLRRRRPETSPLHTDLVTDAVSLARDSEVEYLRIGRRLQRRTARESDRLDIERTVAATIAGGGHLVRPVMARTRALPEYLVLIERRGANDQDYARMRAMLQRLRDMISIEVFSYQSEPSLLEPDGGGRAVAIERLMAAFPNHRLIVLGTGAGFLDPIHKKPLPGAERLTHWERRALLTPLPLSEWAREEYLLARELAMPVGRATPEGLSHLAELLGLEGRGEEENLDPAGDGLARPLPEAFRLHPQRYLYNAPPDDHSIAQVLQDLRNYLDPAGFDWLTALAVYPATQWDLTLYLGLTLKAPHGVEGRLEPLYSERRIGALTQLPWLREGWLPDWLRRALIGAMTPMRRREVRATLARLFNAADVADKALPDLNIRMQIAHEALTKTAPDSVFDDEVLLDFMARGRVEDFELPENALLERIMPREWRKRIGWPELAGAAVAAIYAAAAFIMAPKPADGGWSGHSWLPLLTLGGLAALGLAALHGRDVYRRGRALLERAAIYAVAIALTALFIAAMPSVEGFVLARAPELAAFYPSGLALQSIFALAALGLARKVAETAGVFVPRGETGPGRRFALRLLEALAVAVAANAIMIVVAVNAGLDLAAAQANTWLAAVYVCILCVLLFAAGVVAARFAPERLAPPRDAQQQARVWRWASPLAVAAAPLAIAGLLYTALNATHVVLPDGGSLRVRDADIVATTQRGDFFATGGADGLVRVFASSKLRRPLVAEALGGGAITSLVFQEQTAGQPSLGVVSYDGAVEMIDARTGARTLLARVHSVSTPPLLALDSAGGWLIAFEDALGVQQVVDQAGATAVGGPAAITALQAIGPGLYAVGTLAGDIDLLRSGADGLQWDTPVEQRTDPDLSAYAGVWARDDAACSDGAVTIRAENGALVVQAADLTSVETPIRYDGDWLETVSQSVVRGYRLEGPRLRFRDSAGRETELVRCA